MRASSLSINKYSYLSKKTNGSLARLNTEKSEINNKLTKSLSLFSTTSNQFKVEEMLVIYYISIVIRLCKLSDGLKAINEYKKKKDLSKRATAHLYKLEGVLTLLSEKKEYHEAKKHFNNALKYFYKIGSTKGRAICRLALVRVQCEIELSKDSQERDLKKLIAIVEKAKSQFSNLGFKLGEERANLYLEYLNKRINGEEDKNFKKLIKFKTLKRTHIETAKASDSLLEQSILNDEDIRLFVEVIEEDNDIRHDRIRYKSNSSSVNRSSFRTDENKSMSLLNSKSDIAGRLNRSKFSSKKGSIKFGAKKRFFLKKSSETPLKHRLKKSAIISLERIPTLLHKDSAKTDGCI